MRGRPVLRQNVEDIKYMNRKVWAIRESGATLVIAVFFIVLIISIASIGLGLGLVVSSKARAQNVANLLAMAVLETAIRDGSDANVRTVVDELIKNNKIPGITEWSTFSKSPMEGGGGIIKFGNWYYDDPDGPSPIGPQNPCTDSYPCFIDAPNYAPGLNAAVVSMMGNDATNKVIAPFLNIFGASAKPFTVTATATIAGQCSVILMDVSRSMTYDTHKPKGIVLEPNVPPSQFIYDAAISSSPETNCPPGSAGNLNSLCQLKASRSVDAAVVPEIHYRSDYRQTSSKVGWVLVDRFLDGPNIEGKYRGPQPMNDLFIGINSSLRRIYDRSRGSLWRGIGFAGLSAEQVGWQPNPVPLVGFGASPGALIQVLNLGNRGTFDIVRTSVHPPIGANFLSHGWFAPPFPANSTTGDSDENPLTEKTNINEALEQAISWFSGGTNGGLACPVNFQKTIYVVSDGLLNCYKTATTPPYVCENSYRGFSKARDQLISVLIPELVSKKIKVSTVVAGSSAGAHFINYLAPSDYSTNSGSKFFSAQEALAYGYLAMGSSAQQPVVSSEPVVSTNYAQWCSDIPGCTLPDPYFQNTYAILNLGELGVSFREGGAVMAKLSVDTGGTFCPVLPVSPNPGHYVDPGNGRKIYDDSLRSEGKPQIYAVEYKHIPEQIAECFESKWNNKYVLVGN